MRLKQKTSFETRVEPVLTEAPHPARAEHLEAARQADAVWRAARQARFARPLAWLKRWTGLLELWLGMLAFAAVALMFLTVAVSPLLATLWKPSRLAPYVLLIEPCVVAFLVLGVAAVSVRWFSEQLQRRIRARAATEAVDLDD